MLTFLKGFWFFLLRQKRFWLLPIVIATVFVAVLTLTTEDSTIAPFVYTLF